MCFCFLLLCRRDESVTLTLVGSARLETRCCKPGRRRHAQGVLHSEASEAHCGMAVLCLSQTNGMTLNLAWCSHGSRSKSATTSGDWKTRMTCSLTTPTGSLVSSRVLSLSLPCLHFMLIMRGRLHRQHPDKSGPAHTEGLRMIHD